MKTKLSFVLIALWISLPAWSDDTPKDEETKKSTAKEQFQALVKEYSKQQSSLLSEARKAKGDEQRELLQKYSSLGKEFAAKFAKLAGDSAGDPVEVDALFWIVQNANTSREYKSALAKVVAKIGEMPVKDLKAKLATIRTPNAEVVNAIIARAEKDESDVQTADLLGWAALNGPSTPAGQKAVKLLINRDPDHRNLETLCMMLSRGYRAQSVEMLKNILDKSTKGNIKSAAALAIGKALYARTDALGDQPEEGDRVTAEAEKYFKLVIDELGSSNSSRRKEAEKELKSLQTLRVGKSAPEIEASDLDGTDFKLSDYRGKVVLLDFWGHW